jgi:hypothetical protein
VFFAIVIVVGVWGVGFRRRSFDLRRTIRRRRLTHLIMIPTRTTTMRTTMTRMKMIDKMNGEWQKCWTFLADSRISALCDGLLGAFLLMSVGGSRPIRLLGGLVAVVGLMI